MEIKKHLLNAAIPLLVSLAMKSATKHSPVESINANRSAMKGLAQNVRSQLRENAIVVPKMKIENVEMKNFHVVVVATRSKIVETTNARLFAILDLVMNVLTPPRR